MCTVEAVEKPRRSREVTPNNGSAVVNEQLNMSYCQKAAEDSLEIDMLGYHTNFRLCELRDSQRAGPPLHLVL